MSVDTSQDLLKKAESYLNPPELGPVDRKEITDHIHPKGGFTDTLVHDANESLHRMNHMPEVAALMNQHSRTNNIYSIAEQIEENHGLDKKTSEYNTPT